MLQHLSSAVLGLSLAAALTFAQPPAPAVPAAPNTAPAAPPALTLDDLPPSLKLGIRAAFVQSRMPTNPTVVVVPDERSFVSAISSWDLHGGIRFPILIDDGSWSARQAIARFVRAFKPANVYRWRAPDTVAELPPDPEALRNVLEQVAAAPWGIRDATLAPEARAAALKARWDELSFKPPGVVVASPADPAWPGALTLACARGQPLIWLVPGGGPTTPAGYMAIDVADSFSHEIERLAESTGFKWRALGDDLDAVTICLNCATKVFLGDTKDDRAMLSLTDLVGRMTAPPSDKSRKDRWAWAGQVIGTPWQSAYAAMSSIFLRPESAWLFDGYDDGPPWNQWDATQTGEFFKRGGLSVTIDDGSRRSLEAWRRRAAGGFVPGAVAGGGGVAADLITVTTSGNQDFFDLKPGQAKPADIPILLHPALVYFVHSWSAQTPSDVRTIAGRWIDRGAYAYVGSVHEPFLQAFVPTPKFAQRLLVGLPLGAAARLDNGDVWKISILGDPLITIGRAENVPQPKVAEKPLPLAGAADLQAELTDALKAQPADFKRAITVLTLTGRDADANKLLQAVLREQRDKLTPEAALAAVPAAFAVGDLASLTATYRIAQPLLASEDQIDQAGLHGARDMLWHALWANHAKLTPEQLELLRKSIRAEVSARDTAESRPR